MPNGGRDFGTVTCKEVAEDMSDNTVSVQHQMKPDARTFGGVSGGPCFVVRRDYEPYLIGFVTEHVGFSSVEDNFLQLTTSNCINEDGTIKPASSFYGS